MKSGCNNDVSSTLPLARLLTSLVKSVPVVRMTVGKALVLSGVINTAGIWAVAVPLLKDTLNTMWAKEGAASRPDMKASADIFERSIASSVKAYGHKPKDKQVTFVLHLRSASRFERWKPTTHKPLPCIA